MARPAELTAEGLQALGGVREGRREDDLASMVTTVSNISLKTARDEYSRGHLPSAQKAIDGRQEIRHRNRFRDIGFASTAADLFLVTLHCEGRDGDHRNRFQIIIGLDPLRDFQSGNFRAEYPSGSGQDGVRAPAGAPLDRL